MSVASENDHVIFEHNTCVTISSCWSSSLHVGKCHFLAWSSYARWHSLVIFTSHSTTHVHSFFLHLLIVYIEVRSVVVFDEERILHGHWRWRVEFDLPVVVEWLCLLELSKHIHVSKGLALVSLPVAGCLRLLICCWLPQVLCDWTVQFVWRVVIWAHWAWWWFTSLLSIRTTHWGIGWLLHNHPFILANWI